MSEFTEGVLFGAFVDEARRWMIETTSRLEGIMSDISDMQVKLDAQSAAIGQEAVDLQELQDRVNALIETISVQVTSLQAANDALAAERDNLSAQIGADHAAVAAANAMIDANNASISGLSASMDAFKAAPPAEPVV